MYRYSYQSGKELALEMDRRDDMAGFRSEFYLLEDKIYLNGNSLGLLSKRAQMTLLEVLEDWKKRGLMSGWMRNTYGSSWLKK